MQKFLLHLIFISLLLTVFFTNCEEVVEAGQIDENGNICLVAGTCQNSVNCLNCSYIDNVNNCINVTFSKNVSNSENVTQSINCTNLINVSYAYNVDDCENSDYVNNSKNVYDSIHILNCSDCQSCENVSHAIKVSDVADSQFLYNVSSSNNCLQVYNTSNCYDCFNVTYSRFCTKCHRCYQCEDCSRCIGYKCKGIEDCRDWIVPDSGNTKAWQCTNPLFIEEMFKKDGYQMPTFLSTAQVSTGFAMCHGFEGNRSCCSAETTKQLKKIFDHYKETLELRAGVRVKQLKKIFQAYKELNYTNVPNSVEMRNGLIERMREVKIMIYKMSLSMGTCGQKMLEWISAMLCMGCLPDWRWQKFVQINNSYPTDEQFYDFDPDIPWTQDYATINLDNIYAKEISISKQMCDATFLECKEIIEKYRLFKNQTANAIGNLTEGLTANQEWNTTENSKDTKDAITKRIAELTGTELEYMHRDDDDTRPSASKSPSSQPTVSKDQEKVQEFKRSLYTIGEEYPFDPTVYLSFHPQINFERAIYMDDQMCEATALTEVDMCSFCVYHNDTVWDGEEEWEPANEDCLSEDNAIYIEIDDETNRQYREFSAYFSQVRSVIAIYEDKATEDSYTRHLLFPPFREAEIYMLVKNKTFAERKEYYSELERNIVEQYTLFKAEKAKQDDFTIWNDEYWMFFVYGGAINQGKTIYKILLKSWIEAGHTMLDPHIFTCDYDNTCKLCNKNMETECYTESSVPYISYCEDCHYSKVKLQATCRDNSCISCIYIGGDSEDLDEDDGTQNDPMEKCWIRAYRPYFNEEDYPDSQYFPPFHRDRADPDQLIFILIEEVFDFANRKNIRYNVATISEWYYLRSPQDEILRYSIKNVRYLYNKTGSLKPPDMTNGTKYPYREYCQIDHPVNDCKDRLCDKMLTSFFPKYKISYDPQETNDTEIESLYATSAIFNKDWIQSTTMPEGSWQMAFGAYSQEDNDTYYDAKLLIYCQGPLMIYENETIITIEGINQFTDLEQAAQNEEQFVFAVVIKSMLSVWILISIFWII